jgi:hypothetical protein
MNVKGEAEMTTEPMAERVKRHPFLQGIGHDQLGIAITNAPSPKPPGYRWLCVRCCARKGYVLTNGGVHARLQQLMLKAYEEAKH